MEHVDRHCATQKNMLGCKCINKDVLDCDWTHAKS